MNRSPKRVAIQKVVETAPDHPTADWIYLQVREEIPGISLATVYRNLKQLLDAGHLKAVQDGRQLRYDGNLERHDHFHCSRCGRLTDIPLDPTAVIAQAKERYPFRIDEARIELTGICETCSQAAQNEGIRT